MVIHLLIPQNGKTSRLLLAMLFWCTLHSGEFAAAQSEGRIEGAAQSRSSLLQHPDTEMMEQNVAAPKERLIRRFRNEREASPLVEALTQKYVLQTKLDVLDALVAERQDILNRHIRSLQVNYGVSSEKNYQFDAETGSLYEVSRRVDSGESTRSMMATFTNDERLAFLADAGARNLAREQLITLTLIRVEKNQELEEVNKVLRLEYNLDENGFYRYSVDDNALYELTPSD